MKKFYITAVISLLFILSGYASFSQDANKLIRKMDSLMQAPKDKAGKVKIILTNIKSGKEKVREAIMMQKGKDKRLYRYTLPESQAGIATLSLPDGVMWMYMPAFGKPKKISLLSRSQAFTGTDFSYEDMDPKSYEERYTAGLLKNDDMSYTLELVPRSGKSKYSRLILHINKDYYYPELIEYFDKGNKKIKEATYKYKNNGQYWYAEEVVMTDLKKRHSTTIIMTDVKFDQGLSDEDFTVENLKPKKEEEK